MVGVGFGEVCGHLVVLVEQFFLGGVEPQYVVGDVDAGDCCLVCDGVGYC